MFIEVTSWLTNRQFLLNLDEVKALVRTETCVEVWLCNGDTWYINESFDEVKRIMRYVGKLGTDEVSYGMRVEL
jgi:hypothetical protein